MLAKAGMVEGKDYTTVGIEGFDPLVHIKLPGLAGFPGYKSNEPGTLERAGISFTLFDPSKDGIPGSFGVIYTNAGFLTEHPTAAQDFVRASMRGMEDALADPKAAAQAAVDLINANGNKSFLSPEGEQFRWTTESGLVTQFTPKGQPVGLIDPADLQSQIDAYDAVGIFTKKPTIDGHLRLRRSSPASTARTARSSGRPGERRYANGPDARRTARKSATSNPGTWAAATLSNQLKRTVSGCARTSSTSRRVNAAGKLLPRPLVEHRPHRVVGRTVGAGAADVDADATVGDPRLRALVLGDGTGRVEGDHVPHVLGPGPLHAVVEQQRADDVGPAHVEPLRAVVAPRQAEVVEERAEVEDLLVDLHPLGTRDQRGELVAAPAVAGQLAIALGVEQRPGLPGERRVGRRDQVIGHR